MKPIQTFSVTRLADGQLQVHNKTEAEQEEVRMDYPETEQEKVQREQRAQKEQREMDDKKEEEEKMN